MHAWERMLFQKEYAGLRVKFFILVLDHKLLMILMIRLRGDITKSYYYATLDDILEATHSFYH